MRVITIFISNQDFAVEYLVVSQDIVQHLFVEVLRR